MPVDFVLAAVQGFALGASLIIAIGAQNAFVLRQGLKRQQVLLVTTICFLSDAVLIAVGAGGFAGLVAAVPGLPALAAWGGAVFLIGYGARAFHAALRPARLLAGHGSAGSGTAALAGATLAVSLLNPHVYLDTVVLLGSVAAQYPRPERIAFALGGIGASAVWFYGLGYGAARLAPVFARPAAWRLLDLAIGAIMWAIAGGLIWGRIAS
jgi:L-lysine exporter family protein LysE/ArgO